jgi:4-hydroxybenzoate polyprenyltransferase
MYLLRILISLGLWIVAILTILAGVLNGWNWIYIIGALFAWWLAIWVWPRQQEQQRKQHRTDGLEALDLLDLLFALIEWPLRLLLWLIRRLDDIVGGTH